jgi:hypothetical protein
MKHNFIFEIVICFIFLFFAILYFIDHYTLSNTNGSYVIMPKATRTEAFNNHNIIDPLNIEEYNNTNQPFSLLYDTLPVKDVQAAGSLNYIEWSDVFVTNPLTDPGDCIVVNLQDITNGVIYRITYSKAPYAYSIVIERLL